MISVPMVIQLSKHAMDLINAGKAVWGPGGVRLLNGQLVELYKFTSPLIGNQSAQLTPFMPYMPSVSMNLNPITGALGLAGQAANIGLSYQNGKKLTKVIQAVATLQKVAWAGTALSAASLALSTASFAVLSSKLDGLSTQLTSAVEELKQEMHKIQIEDKTIEIRTLINNLKSTSYMLEQNSLSKNDVLRIESYLNNAEQLILWLQEKFEKAGPVESNTLFTLLYDLTSMYAMVLKHYGTQYFYLEERFPGNFNGWIEAFKYADSRTLQSGLKRTIWIENPLELTEKMEAAYDFTLNTVRIQQKELEETQEIIPQIPHEAYTDFDAYVKQRIEKGEVDIVDEAQQDDPHEKILLLKNGFEAA